MGEAGRTTDDGADSGLALLCIRGVAEGLAFGVATTEQTLGRSEACDIRLVDEGVSRVHARLAWRDGALMLVDQESTNGTHVDGERQDVIQLQVGMEIELGPRLCLRLVKIDDSVQLMPEPSFGVRTVEDAQLLDALRQEHRAIRSIDGLLTLVAVEIDTCDASRSDASEMASQLMYRLMFSLRRMDRGLRDRPNRCVFVLRGLGRDGGQAVANRLCTTAREAELPSVDGPMRCTISAGVLQCDPDTELEPQLELLNARLLAAQAAGGDRVCDQTP